MKYSKHLKVLILSCGTGGGHNAAAEAVKEQFEKNGHETVLMNPYDLKSKKLAESINNIYIKSVQTAPGIFGKVYGLGEIYRKLPGRSPVYYINKKIAVLLYEYIRKEQFDIIVMSHLFPAEIITYIRLHGGMLPQTIYIATDYACIPFTEETICDKYVIPAKSLKYEFESHGIEETRLSFAGIPVKAAFRENITKQEAIQTLKLNPQRRYILIEGGSVGAGNIKRIVQLLYEKYHDSVYKLIVVCGKNTKLFDELWKRYENAVIILKYVDNLHMYMKASDVFITKGGGLSSTEAAVSGIPIIHVTPIPGCETKNCRFFSRSGMSIWVKNPQKQLIPSMEKLMDGKRSGVMRDRQQSIINREAAEDICELAENMVSQIHMK